MRKFILMTGLLLAPQLALAQTPVPDIIARQVPDAAFVGQGRLRYMMMDIYDAILFAPKGQWQPDAPMALRLVYLRHLSGARIADRSVEEMRKEGFGDEIKLAAWHSQLRDIFPDVEDGSALTGVQTKSGGTIFYLGSKEIGRIDDREFSRRFFAIWLADNTSEPGLRAELLHQPG